MVFHSVVLVYSEAYLIPHKPDILLNSHDYPHLLLRNSQQQLTGTGRELLWQKRAYHCRRVELVRNYKMYILYISWYIRRQNNSMKCKIGNKRLV